MAKRSLILTNEEIEKLRMCMHITLKFGPDQMSGLNAVDDFKHLNDLLKGAPVAPEPSAPLMEELES